jgi:pSer/pThr/pTyr-binding forkhead associated (FHA) protein
MPEEKVPNGSRMDRTVILEGTGRLKGAGALASRAVLLALSRQSFGMAFVLSKPQTLIGRNPGCDLILPDPLVSARHCRVTADEEGGFFLEDLNSTNSTILNSRPIRKASRLRYGDRIVIGETILRFFLEERLIRR